MKNKMQLTSLVLLVMVLLALSVHARSVPQLMSGGLVEINNFFSGENYRPYAKAIDFFFFALLFIALYLMGAKYAFKEIKSPEKAIVMLLGLMTAFLLVLGGFSATMLLPWIHWLFYFLLFLFWWFVLKDIKNTFWRFLLALLLTLLTIALMQGLLDYLTPPQVPNVPGVNVPGVPSIGLPSVGVSGFFKDFFGGFKLATLPGVSMPGVPNYIKDWIGVKPTITITTPQVPNPGTTDVCPNIAGTQTDPKDCPTIVQPPTNTTKDECPDEKLYPGIQTDPKDCKKTSIWWLLPLLLLIPLLWFVPWGKLKDRIKKKATEVQEEDKRTKDERTLRQIMSEIEEIIALKQSILKKLRQIMEVKRKASLAFWELYHKKINHPAFLADPDSDEHKNLINENDAVSRLLKLELELEQELIKLRRIEEKLNNEYDGPITGSRGEVVKDELGNPKLIKRKPKLVEWSEQLSEIYAQHYPETSAAPQWYMQAVGTAFGIIIKLYGREFFRRFTGQALVERILGSRLEKILGERGIIEEVKEAIALLFLITKEASERERQLKKLIDLNKLEYWLFKSEGKYERWIELQTKEADELKQFWEQQERAFLENIHDFDVTDPNNPKFQFDAQGKVVLKSAGLLVPLINEQMRYLQMLLKILQFLESERKSFTRLQELNVAIRNNRDPTKWDNIDPVSIADLTKTYNIGGKRITKIKDRVRRYEIDRQPIKIFTNFAEGLPPFNVICYVDGKKANATWDPANISNYSVSPLVANSKYPANETEESVVRFYSTNEEFPREMEIGPLSVGQHEITVIAISAKDTFKRRSEKTIIVTVNPTINRTLTLRPTNSIPQNPLPNGTINIISAYHKRQNALKIGKGEDVNFANKIQLVDTGIYPAARPNVQQIQIVFLEDNTCVISKIIKETVLEIDGVQITTPLRLNPGRHRIKINEYEFEAELSGDNIDPMPSLQDYNSQFPIKLKLSVAPYDEPYNIPYQAPYDIPYDIPNDAPYNIPYGTIIIIPKESKKITAKSSVPHILPKGTKIILPSDGDEKLNYGGLNQYDVPYPYGDDSKTSYQVPPPYLTPYNKEKGVYNVYSELYVTIYSSYPLVIEPGKRIELPPHSIISPHPQAPIAEKDKSNPRVLMFTYKMHLAYGGVGTQSYLIYKKLFEKGLNIEVIENSYETKEVILYRNGNQIRYKDFDEFINSCPQDYYDIFYFQWYPIRVELKSFLTKLKNHFINSKIAYVIRTDPRSGLSYTQSGSKNYSIYQRETQQQDIMISMSDIIIHLTPASVKTFSGYYPNIERKSVIISDAVEVLEEKHERDPRYRDSIVFLHLGRLTEEKGTYKLAAAYNHIYRVSKDKKMVFIFAGNGSIEDYQSKIKKCMPDVPGENIEFTGLVGIEQKTKYLQMADLFILPTYREMLPNSVLEATVSGVPVVLTRLSSVDQLYYERGITVPIGLKPDIVPEVEDIIKSVEWSIKNLSLLKKRSRYFQERFQKVYSFENFIRKTNHVFNALSRNKDMTFIKNLCIRLEDNDANTIPRLQPIDIEKEYEEKIYDVDVSYIVPVYNVQDYILDGIKSLVNQKFNGKYNILIVNDGSKDNSIDRVRKNFKKEIEKEKIIILDNEFKIEGTTFVGGARNYGFYKIVNGFDGREVRPKYISHFDPDDIAFPTRTQVLFDYMEGSKSDMVCSRAITIDEYNRPNLRRNALQWDCKRLGKIYGKPSSWAQKVIQSINFGHADSWRNFERMVVKELPELREDIGPLILIKEPLVHNQTTMVTLEVMYRTGGQDEKLRRGQDSDFWIKMAQTGAKMDFLNQSVAFYRYGKDRDLQAADDCLKKADPKKAYLYYINYITEFLRDYELTRTVPGTQLINRNKLVLSGVRRAIVAVIEISKVINEYTIIENLYWDFVQKKYDKKYSELFRIIDLEKSRPKTSLGNMYLLTLIPKNSRSGPIDIASFNHNKKANFLKIGKDSDADIILEDSEREGLHAYIGFNDGKERFEIRPNGTSIIWINKSRIKEVAGLGNEDILNINNEYEFEVRISPADGKSISETFPIALNIVIQGIDTSSIDLGGMADDELSAGIADATKKAVIQHRPMDKRRRQDLRRLIEREEE